MARSTDTAERLARIKEMSLSPPETVIAAAMIHDPAAIAVTSELNALVERHIRAGGSPGATVNLCIAALGYTLGGNVKTTAEGAGEALEHQVETMVGILRYTADAGFAEARKEQTHG